MCKKVYWHMLAVALLVAGIAVDAAKLPAEAQPSLRGVQSVILTPMRLHEGWTASTLLNAEISSRDGKSVGLLRNIVFTPTGLPEALVVESKETATVIRVPWREVEPATIPKSTRLRISAEKFRSYGLFPAAQRLGRVPEELLLSNVIGNFVRLSAGFGYGYVKDVVLTQAGRIMAILVMRSARSGGGIVAFNFIGKEIVSSHSGLRLPFVTTQAANRVALKVDIGRYR